MPIKTFSNDSLAMSSKMHHKAQKEDRTHLAFSVAEEDFSSPSAQKSGTGVTELKH